MPTESDLTARIRAASAGLAALAEGHQPLQAGKFDNRETWDNKKGGFDNRPGWDNWDKRKR